MAIEVLCIIDSVGGCALGVAIFLIFCRDARVLLFGMYERFHFIHKQAPYASHLPLFLLARRNWIGNSDLRRTILRSILLVNILACLKG